MSQVIRGFTVVFCPLTERTRWWLKLGVPNSLIHHDLGDAFQKIVDRQRTLLSNPHYPASNVVNVVLDYEKDRDIDPTPEEFWEEHINLTSKQKEWSELSIVFHLDSSKIVKVIQPGSVLYYSKLME